MPKKTIYFFLPFASIGGTEQVHLDVLRALDQYEKKIIFRYRVNPWKGKQAMNDTQVQVESIAWLSEFKKWGETFFSSDYLESKRFGRFWSRRWRNKCLKALHSNPDNILVFWHRESLEFLWPYLDKNLKIIDLVHNNTHASIPDGRYLVNDWVPRINQRVLVSKGLMAFIRPLYLDSNYPATYFDRIKSIPHAVNLPATRPTKSRETIRVLFMGRDAVEKRIPLLAEVIRQSESTLPHVFFDVIGFDQHPDLPNSLSNVKLHGLISDRIEIEEKLKSAHFLLLTSESEGFPKVIAEGMAFGVVPLVPQLGAIGTHLVHLENSILMSPESVVNEALLNLRMATDGDLDWDSMSLNAYLYAQENFDFERFKTQWIECIDALS